LREPIIQRGSAKARSAVVDCGQSFHTADRIRSEQFNATALRAPWTVSFAVAAHPKISGDGRTGPRHVRLDDGGVR
jgi:hypothetical protein